jgi:CheY-like chemotaxis protein
MSTPSKHVLVVDDDRHLRFILAHLLKAEGYRVTAAADGQEALDALAGEEPPCFIHLDLQMPGMDGGTFLRERARARLHPEVPVVTLSGCLSSSEELVGLGVANHFIKPVPVEELLDLVRKLC